MARTPDREAAIGRITLGAHAGTPAQVSVLYRRARLSRIPPGLAGSSSPLGQARPRMRSRSGGSSAVPGARRRGRVVARADETPHRLQFRYWRPVPARKAQLWFLRLADYADRSPSRRVDPIQYVAPSSRYDSLPVSSGHQVGSKTAVPKLSVSASAVLKRFDRARTIFVVILGPPSFSSSRSALRPCVGSSGDGVAEPSESGS